MLEHKSKSAEDTIPVERSHCSRRSHIERQIGLRRPEEVKEESKENEEQNPKEAHKCLDKYLKAKMDEHLYKAATPFDTYLDPPVLQCQQGYYNEKPEEVVPNTGLFAQPLKY